MPNTLVKSVYSVLAMHILILITVQSKALIPFWAVFGIIQYS